MSAAALVYTEPDIVTILKLASFLLLLNAVNYILDSVIYCGLLGQVFIGIAWGSPGAAWLSPEVQSTVMQLGYLGLILIVYEGGLSTSFTALKANLFLSIMVALTGITGPIALSFSLMRVLDITPLQAFAAGAALCSTSLGTTFTILSSSGLSSSRLGVILSSAAMLDDVVGLVMVQVISNLGPASASVSSVTVIRPVFVSLAYAVVVPLCCWGLVLPLTRKLRGMNAKSPRVVAVYQFARKSVVVLAVHTLVLVAFVTSASYAGASNLFAAYLAGAATNWWDTIPAKLNGDEKGYAAAALLELHTQSDVQRQQEGHEPASSVVGTHDQPVAKEDECKTLRKGPTIENKNQSMDIPTGLDIYKRYYAPTVSAILKPFFFASIGFSIPITQMFSGPIVWKGLIYTLLMIIGKLLCGLWLVRFRSPVRDLSFPTLVPFFRREGPYSASAQSPLADVPTARNPDPDPHPTTVLRSHPVTSKSPPKKANHETPAKPASLYPATILSSAMVARGEIGFLISSVAESNGVLAGSANEKASSQLYLVVTWAILLCTIAGPVGVGVLVRRVRRLQREERGRRTGKEDPLGVWGVE